MRDDDYKRLRKAAQDLFEYVTDDTIKEPVWFDKTKELLEELGKVLAETSEDSEMERLRSRIIALETKEREWADFYAEQGDIEAARDSTMKANGMGKILDVMLTKFGYGEE